jgi:lipopolysaccharide/colanic/teichoic acid biosynthesis glycosyltransferase
MRQQVMYTRVKRAVDLVIAVLAVVWWLPLMTFIALLIRLDSPGPVLFVQVRIGKDGRPFRMFKFRTLRSAVDDSAHRAFMSAFVRGETQRRRNGRPIYKPFRRSELTRLGPFLRRTSLDELPQLMNVIRGDMSLVGPRPNVPWEVAAYKEWHKKRLAVLPGITGLAQVNGRSGLEFDEIARYDIEYVDQQSLRLDLEILWRTVLTVFGGRGAH